MQAIGYLPSEFQRMLWKYEIQVMSGSRKNGVSHRSTNQIDRSILWVQFDDLLDNWG
jgi:hypothetical protein